MKMFLELIGRVPEWAVKVAFVVLVLMAADMYLRSAKAFYFGDTVVGFLGRDKLQSKVIWMTGEPRMSNYPNGTWVNTTKSVNCPDGYVVTGVNVVYGGTCNRTCDADGGVVRQLELVCRSLITHAPPGKASGG